MADAPLLSARDGVGDPPPDAIAAATHPDPYPYYARLAAERPLAFDPGLGVWVAASADAVRAVLTSPACRVRPAAEPVPSALVGTPAEPLFRALARMNDGPAHARARAAVTSRLDAVDVPSLAREAARCAERLVRTLSPARDADRLAAFASALPCHVLGRLLGVGDDALDRLTEDVGALVRCLFPGGSKAEVAAGAQAAARLLARFSGGAPDAADAPPGVANAIGLLAQAYDATAGLVGNTILALTRRHRAGASASPDELDAVVADVARSDPSIQNTRRFVAEPVALLARRLAPGDTILVVLAAAGRDPAAASEADGACAAAHDLDVGFGLGMHACPGRGIALAIARAGVARLLAAGLDLERIDPAPAYRPSPNARVPLLRLRPA